MTERGNMKFEKAHSTLFAVYIAFKTSYLGVRRKTEFKDMSEVQYFQMSHILKKLKRTKIDKRFLEFCKSSCMCVYLA